MNLDKIGFAFSEVFSKVFIYTGPQDKPTQKYDITGHFYEWIIGMFLRKPGLIVAPDSSEFLLTLTLTPAAAAAKQAMLEKAQQETTAANLTVIRPQPETDEWAKAAWALNLTDTDKVFFRRIAEAREKGSRISYRTTRPDEFTVKVAAPPKAKKKGSTIMVSTQATEQGQDRHDQAAADFANGTTNPNGAKLFVPTWDADPSTERVPVVVVSIPESNSGTFIVTREDWDGYGDIPNSTGNDWLEHATWMFAEANGLDRHDITEVDLSQTRTRAELAALPHFSF